MTLNDALRSLAPFARQNDFDTEGWCGYLDSSGTSSDMERVLRDVLSAGQLTPELWRGVTGCEQPEDFVTAFGLAWHRLVAAGYAVTAEGMPSSWTPDSLRLWAYTTCT